MRWVGGLETMAQDKQRARNKGAIARRLAAELAPYRGALLQALLFILISAATPYSL